MIKNFTLDLMMTAISFMAIPAGETSLLLVLAQTGAQYIFQIMIVPLSKLMKLVTLI